MPTEAHLEAAVLASVAAAAHLTPADDAAVQALLTVARKIDQDEWRWDQLAAWAEQHNGRPPSQDNVSLPTFLKYCEALGITPSGRSKLPAVKQEAPSGKLALLQGHAAGVRKAR